MTTNNKFIPQMEPWFGDEEREALNDYMLSGGWVTEFQKTAEFENSICDFTGAKYCVVVNNGTISLTLAALACGIVAGDEVIVPNYTMIATPNSIKMIGAKPVFVDIELDSLCLNLDLIDERITERTKAVILVNANGRYPSANVSEIVAYCKNRNITLIEDSAQALGSRYPNGAHMGTIGAVGSFSFSMPKIITTGQGGALITNDSIIYEKLKKLKDFGRLQGGIDTHDTLGWNFKFTDIQAVLGIEQMKKLEWRIRRKKEIYEVYKHHLSSVSEINIFHQDLENTTPWFIDVMVHKERDGLVEHLKSSGVGTRLMYPPINTQAVYSEQGSYPVSTSVGQKGLWLPSASQLEDSQVKTICSKIKNYYSKS